MSPLDIAIVAAGSFVLLFVAGAATLLPAYRATKVVPVESLRED